MKDKLLELKQGMNMAFINKSYSSSLAYTPQFISNNYHEGRKVLSSIEEELSNCDEFAISVAFINMSGVTPLLQTLKELEKRGIKGKILTTDYLCFSEPKALTVLNNLSNVELKMYMTQNSSEGFHTKGYVFRDGDINRIIIGSANITQSALTTNKEWNTKIISTDEGEFANNLYYEFSTIWNDANSKPYEEFIDEYTENYLKNKLIRDQQELVKSSRTPSLEAYKLKPNLMQVKFINNLKNIYDTGEDRALLISATGTGKTYASAFAMRELGFKRVLFLVHRNRIAIQAYDSYQKVLGENVTRGLLTGDSKNYESDYLFATMQTLSREDTLKQFSPDAFDTIIIDEAHHSSAGSYKKIMEYFTPKLWLGMTATPDKRDDDLEGRNIYEIFDHNIACEIRLQDALEEDLLCPFHYFGITDIAFEEYGANNFTDKVEDFRYLTSDERVENVMKQAEYFGYSGDRVKGLIFCSRIEEAKTLSEKFNEKGWRTVALSGSDSIEYRENAIERLAGDDCEDALDYIISVDIFSEGVDVPEINQIIMLRPTQSPIVFIQQLGRCLRKAKGKEYAVILDFIGNYNNNFMIPIALSGDRTYNKDNIRRYVTSGERIIPGASTVHFDEISRKKIFKSIDNANFNNIKLIKENYTNLKNKLGYIPALMDFDKYGEIDVTLIFDNSSLGSYYKFLEKYEKDYTVRLSKEESKMIEFVSKKFANGKRIHELQLLKQIIETKNASLELLKDSLKDEYDCDMDENCRLNIINIMTNNFSTGAAKNTYSDCIILEESEAGFVPSKSLLAMLQNPDFMMILEELVEFGISRYIKTYSDKYKDTNFVLYQKYTYEDACRLLNWEKNEVPLNIGGYKYDKKTKTFPVFINYDKSDEISDTTKYEDRFLNEKTLISISKNGRGLESEDVKNFLYSKERGIDVELFVRKNKDDKISKEFYYLGKISPEGQTAVINMPNTNKTAVEIMWTLDTPLRKDLYDYIVEA